MRNVGETGEGGDGAAGLSLSLAQVVKNEPSVEKSMIKKSS